MKQKTVNSGEEVADDYKSKWLKSDNENLCFNNLKDTQEEKVLQKKSLKMLSFSFQ